MVLYEVVRFESGSSVTPPCHVVPRSSLRHDSTCSPFTSPSPPALPRVTVHTHAGGAVILPGHVTQYNWSK